MREYHDIFAYDTDASPFHSNGGTQGLDHEHTSHEVRFSGVALNERLDYTVGAYYVDQSKAQHIGQINLYYTQLNFVHGPDLTPSDSHGRVRAHGVASGREARCLARLPEDRRLEVLSVAAAQPGRLGNHGAVRCAPGDPASLATAELLAADPGGCGLQRPQRYVRERPRRLSHRARLPDHRRPDALHVVRDRVQRRRHQPAAVLRDADRDVRRGGDRDDGDRRQDAVRERHRPAQRGVLPERPEGHPAQSGAVRDTGAGRRHACRHRPRRHARTSSARRARSRKTSATPT